MSEQLFYFFSLFSHDGYLAKNIPKSFFPDNSDNHAIEIKILGANRIQFKSSKRSMIVKAAESLISILDKNKVNFDLAIENKIKLLNEDAFDILPKYIRIQSKIDAVAFKVSFFTIYENIIYRVDLDITNSSTIKSTVSLFDKGHSELDKQYQSLLDVSQSITDDIFSLSKVEA